MITNKMLAIFAELAVTNPTGASTHQEVNFGLLLEPKLRKVFYETWDELAEQYSQVFKVQTSKKAQETDYSIGAMSPWGIFGNAVNAVTGGNNQTALPSATTGATLMPTVPYFTVQPGTQRLYTHQEFAQGFMVERKFYDDEQYGVINKMSGDLARAGRYKVETDAASLFNNGFATAIYDGQALFSDAHPLINTTVQAPGTKSDGTALAVGKTSNLIVGGLNDSNLKSAMVKMRQMVDEAGKLIQFKADTLIVPPSLEFVANELIQSSQKAGTTDNDINTMKGRLKVVVLDFLTSQTAWFLMDSSRAQLNFFWRVKPEFKRDEDFDSLVAKYRGYMRYSFGASDFRGIIGSQG